MPSARGRNTVREHDSAPPRRYSPTLEPWKSRARAWSQHLQTHHMPTGELIDQVAQAVLAPKIPGSLQHGGARETAATRDMNRLGRQPDIQRQAPPVL